MTATVAAAGRALNGPAPCALCGNGRVYGVRAFCAWCFRQLTPDLQEAVREVGDLPRDDPRKRAVIARCRDRPWL
ncbi:hypothetical protein ACTD5D_00385 [Nocardia takedensis]|uniref:hypothetical protein n=1 Tax=Nocardia takedensis TaxID=259390 RepID=UPI003F761D1D